MPHGYHSTQKTLQETIIPKKRLKQKPHRDYHIEKTDGLGTLSRVKSYRLLILAQDVPNTFLFCSYQYEYQYRFQSVANVMPLESTVANGNFS